MGTHSRLGTAAIVVCIALIGAAGPSVAAGQPGSWATVAPLPAPTWDAGATRGPDGLVYVSPGALSTAPPYVTDTVRTYDAATDTWAEVAPLPRGLAFTAAATLAGGIYVIGGVRFFNDAFPAVRSVFVYSPEAGSWRRAAPLPQALEGAAAVSSGGKLYVMGGRDSLGNPQTGMFRYDPDTDAWRAMPGVPQDGVPVPRDAFSAATGRDGRIYVFGGCCTESSPGSFTQWYARVDVYDPRTGAWSSAAPMPAARGYTAARRGADGRIYVIGGYSGTAAVATVEAYDPAADAWTAVAPLPAERSHVAAAQGSDGRIYAIGGNNDRFPDGTRVVTAFG